MFTIVASNRRRCSPLSVVPTAIEVIGPIARSGSKRIRTGDNGPGGSSFVNDATATTPTTTSKEVAASAARRPGGCGDVVADGELGQSRSGSLLMAELSHRAAARVAISGVSRPDGLLDFVGSWAGGRSSMPSS